MQEEIIQPIDRELLKAELTLEKWLRVTNGSHNKIFAVTAHDSPNVARGVGRLHETTFRTTGGDTGKPMDTDEFDTCDNRHRQLIVRNPDTDEIIGDYQYQYGSNWELDDNGQPRLVTSHLFHFSDKLLQDYMSYIVEPRRSLVMSEYQNVRRNAKDISTLDNLWDGLGALTVLNPSLKYFFGKITMYLSYTRRGRGMILYFLEKHFDNKDYFIVSRNPLGLQEDPKELEKLFSEMDFKLDYRILNREIRQLGYNVPPLISVYMGLSPMMKLFGTTASNELGGTEGTGILISVDEVLEDKYVRHIDSFVKEHRESLEITSGVNNIIYKGNNNKS